MDNGLREVVLPNYFALVGPHLEYSILLHPVLGSSFMKDRDLLERVQWKVIKSITGLQHLPYEERLRDYSAWRTLRRISLLLMSI